METERDNTSEVDGGATATAEGAQEPPPADAGASRSIMFMLLSSDDGNGFSSSDDGDDDAATTMGSPLAQPNPVTPPAEVLATESAGGSRWTRAKSPRAPPLREARRAPPTRIEDVFAARPRQLQEEAAVEEDEDDAFDSFPPASQQSDVVLSPSSQLHILSQISEMASMRAAREREATAAAATTAARTSRPAHAWAPVAQRAQARQQSSQPPPKTTATGTKKSKKRKTPVDPPMTTRKAPKSTKAMGAGLVAHIATWETFDEPILAGGDDAEDDWSFEEISDSDF